MNRVEEALLLAQPCLPGGVQGQPEESPGQEVFLDSVRLLYCIACIKTLGLYQLWGSENAGEVNF